VQAPPFLIKTKEKSMKVRMKENKQAAPDGITVINYEKGKIYDMPDELDEAFIDQGLAAALKLKKPGETKVEEPDETKVVEPPETKKKK
jgi:hypothetical protein